MPTFTNLGPSSIIYTDMNGSQATADASERFSSPYRYEVIHPAQCKLTSEEPFIDKTRLIQISFSGSGTRMIDLDTAEILKGQQIMVHTASKNLTLEIRLNAATAPIFEKLNYNSGHTYVNIPIERKIANLHLTANVAGTAYVLITRGD